MINYRQSTLQPKVLVLFGRFHQWEDPPRARKSSSTGFGRRLEGQVQHGGHLLNRDVVSDRVVRVRILRVLLPDQPEVGDQRGGEQVSFSLLKTGNISRSRSYKQNSSVEFD